MDLTANYGAAMYVDKILKGAKPQNLPVEQPVKFELIINKKTGQWHTLYVPAEDLAKLPMTAEQLPAPVEQLTISAVPQAPGGAIRLEWENTRFSVPFTVVH